MWTVLKLLATYTYFLACLVLWSIHLSDRTGPDSHVAHMCVRPSVSRTGPDCLCGCVSFYTCYTCVSFYTCCTWKGYLLDKCYTCVSVRPSLGPDRTVFVAVCTSALLGWTGLYPSVFRWIKLSVCSIRPSGLDRMAQTFLQCCSEYCSHQKVPTAS